MKINFRSIKSAVSFVYFIFHFFLFQNIFKNFFCLVPYLVTSNSFFRTSRKFNSIFESKFRINKINQFHYFFYFFFNLFFSAENMRIILRKLYNSE